MEIGFVDLVRCPVTGEADDPVDRAARSAEFLPEGEVTEQAMGRAPQVVEFGRGGIAESLEVGGRVVRHQLIEPGQEPIHGLLIAGDL